MGCAPTPKKAPLVMKESPIGILKLTILGTDIYNHVKVQRPHLKIRISNQTFETDFAVLPSPDNSGQTFTFAINSFYKPNGRIIEIGYFDGKHMVAFGSVDANPIILQRNFQETRCILGKTGMTNMGYVLLKGKFEETPYQELNFRFEQATIRRKTGSCGQDNVAAKLTIGEEELQTEHLPNSLEKPPVWADKVYNFKVPQSLRKGFMELIDDQNNVIGSAELNLDNYTTVKEGEQIIETQTLYYNHNKNIINAADIKYSFINGQKAWFGPRDALMNTIMRAVRPNQVTQGSILMGQNINKQQSQLQARKAEHLDLNSNSNEMQTPVNQLRNIQTQAHNTLRTTKNEIRHSYATGQPNPQNSKTSVAVYTVVKTESIGNNSNI